MPPSLVDIICSTYGSAVQRTALLERVQALSGRVFSLYVEETNPAPCYKLLALRGPRTEDSLNVSAQLMANAVMNGQSFIHFLLTSLNQTTWLNDLGGSETSVDSPTIMGNAIQSKWGALSLMFPQDSTEYSLQVRIAVPDEPRVKQSYPIDRGIVAQAVQAGEAPLFATLRSCPAAAELMAEHDDFLRSVVEADALAQTSLQSVAAAPPRRPKGL